MSGSKFQRHLIAAFASLLMSTIAVGAAVAPAQVSAATVEVVTYAPFQSLLSDNDMQSASSSLSRYTYKHPFSLILPSGFFFCCLYHRLSSTPLLFSTHITY